MVEVKYGLLLPNGKLAKIKSYQGQCEHFELTSDEGYPDWLVDNIKNVEDTLFEDIRYYNSSFEIPSWGGFTNLKAAKIEIHVYEIEVKPPLKVHTIDCHEIKEDSQTRVWCLVAGQKHDFLDYIGQTVCFGSLYNRRTIIEIREAKEKYTEHADEVLQQWKRMNRKVPDGHCVLICETAK